ncbi:hypothetical protein Tco_0731113 [Tanacetum coccineum]
MLVNSEEGGNHKKKDGGKAGESQPASSHVEQVVGDIGKGTTPTPTLDSSVSTIDNSKQGILVTKVVEGVDEPVSKISKSFASLVTNEAVTSKINFRSLESDKPINAKAEVKILETSIFDAHSRFGFSLYGYFIGKIVAFPVVEYYVKNAWEKFGLVRVIMKLKAFFFFKFDSIEGMNKADRELKEDMVISILNVEDDGEVLHTVRLGYEWEPPRRGVCMDPLVEDVRIQYLVVPWLGS